MGRVTGPPLSASDISFLSAQRLFFHATAPASSHTLVNLSPKSSDYFRVVDDTHVAYLDLSGSGCETIAHVRLCDRITIMFVAFEGPPKIVRLHGRAQIVFPQHLHKHPKLLSLYSSFLPGGDSSTFGFRCIVSISLLRVSSSCGFSIPFFGYVGPRNTLNEFTVSKGEKGMHEYRALKNRFSVDGLDGIVETNSKACAEGYPTDVVETDGYLFAYYNQDQALWTMWRRVRTWFKLQYISQVRNRFSRGSYKTILYSREIEIIAAFMAGMIFMRFIALFC